MEKTIVFATHNAHKASEIRSILEGKYIVKTLTDINLFDEIPENGSTFEENSFIKADYVRCRVPENTMCIAVSDHGAAEWTQEQLLVRDGLLPGVMTGHECIREL